jgi:hypothetical protein
MTKVKGLLACIGLLGAASALATPIAGNSLQNTLNGMGAVVNVQTDQYQADEMWRVGATGVSAARIQFELSAYATQNSFGIYDARDTNARLTIFSGADSAGAFGFLFNPSGSTYCAATFSSMMTPTCASFSGAEFGFFLTAPTGNTYYSRTLHNSDGVDHLVAYQGGEGHGTIGGRPWLANEFLLAWEDLAGGGDRDYEDFVVLVESVVGVPEPAALATFGLGLLALGFAVRRRPRGLQVRG